MTLKAQLTDEELALLEVIEDPIWFGEFLRNTRDCSPIRSEWPTRKFWYRYYQRDILTDQNKYIVLTAGRSVGKCQPDTARVYTAHFGYLTINEIMQRQAKHQATVVWAIDPKTRKMVQRIAKVSFNATTEVFRITTEHGKTIDCTGNHPILTQRGYVMVDDLKDDDTVVTARQLMPMTGPACLTWEELRWLGYHLAQPRPAVESPFQVKYQAHITELRKISDFFYTTFRVSGNTVQLKRPQGPLPHYGTQLLRDIGYTYATEGTPYRRISRLVKSLPNESLKILLEPYLSIKSEITPGSVTILQKNKLLAEDIQELLLRFGVETVITLVEEGASKITSSYSITLLDSSAYARFFEAFQLPGIGVTNIPVDYEDRGTVRYEKIASIVSLGRNQTYAITVRDAENYISENVFVHNSLVMEDKMIWEAVNDDIVFPETKEQVLVTANVAQMTPILDRLRMRFLGSKFLKGWVTQFNMSKGTLDFSSTVGSYRMHARIAGSRGESNMVGLHVPRIKGDEFQLFPMPAYIQLRPTFNSWESVTQQLYCGVPSGGREGNVLYYMDQVARHFKKYRIPATENPNWTKENHDEAIKQYGGEESDDFQRLVLGRHGNASSSLIPRDKIVTEPFAFYSHRFSQLDKHSGKDYKQELRTHKLPNNTDYVLLAVDTGYADPTLAQVMTCDVNGIWRTHARYRLTRIPFPEQSDIIDYLDSFYKFNTIALDLGAGGGGIGIMQDLHGPRFSAAKNYKDRVIGVQFSGNVATEEVAQETSTKTQAKSFGGIELARLITEGHLRFSELDAEGMSQLERVAYQRRPDGSNMYFVISERGLGKSEDDHIFASYIVFVLALLSLSNVKPRTRLMSARWF